MKKLLLPCLILLCGSALAQAPKGIATVDPPASQGTSGNASVTTVPTQGCLTDVYRQKTALKYTAAPYSESFMNQRILQHVQGGGARSLLYVPVVVHIVHNNGTENISDQTVMQGIQDLNDAFANTGSYYSPTGADMGIRFCLAQQDPDGLPTNGITRHVSPLTEVTADNQQDLDLKNIVRWDPTRYVNIWLVREITSQAMGASVAGYALLPNGHGTPEDGIVNEARWFGHNTDDSKVHIHEMGHYLGLYHTFEGGCTNNNCQTDGDHVCDTPPDGTSLPSPCNSFSNTCSTDDDDLSPNNPFRPVALGGLGDQDDPMEDYMDYGLQTCQKLFTEGQGERMRNALQTTRASLLESQVCQTSCGIGITGIDTSNILTVTAGALVQIQSHYTATVPVTFAWEYNGQVISTQETLSHTFTNANIGQRYLYLHWINAADNCQLTDSILLRVKCNPPAAFTFSPYVMEPGVPVTFTGYNAAATSYQWFLNGVPVSTSANFTHTFASGGVNHMYLVTGNGQCYDTSAIQYLGVGACGSGENNHWVISGAGAGTHIDFSSGSPTVTPVESNGSNAMGTIEGTATQSDRNGNLLFYSDGSKLFNRNHEAFFTGMGAGSSSAQGVLIVPDPGNTQSYYVFTAENFGGISYPTLRGLAYLKVDMTMNGGLGGVSSSYITLLNQTSEKLTATKHCNGTDIWVVAHGFNDNKFYSYPITAAGLGTPVISAVGTSQYSSNNTNGSQGIGNHKISPDGTKLFSSATYLGFAELFDFDNSTGAISNPAMFPVGSFVYSGEFSPDGSKLYYALDGNKNIYCMDVTSGNAQIMNQSVTVVGTSNVANYLGIFHTGPDGKIYVARTDGYMDVINNPDAGPGACNFETQALTLPGGSFYGLNNIYVPPRYSGPQIIGPANICVGQTNVKYKVGCGNNTWEYHGHNGYTLLSQKEVSINFTTVGIDTLICHRANTCNGAGSDTLYIHVGGNMANLGPNVSMCSSASTVLNPGSGFYSVLWSTGANTPTLTVTQPGTYWVQVTGLGGCTDRDTIVVAGFNGTFNVPDEPLIKVCGQGPGIPSYTAHAQQGNFTHVWTGTQSAGATYTALLTNEFTRIPITYFNAQGCADKDTFVIQKVNSPPPVSIGNDTIICPGQLLILHAPANYPFQAYEWNDGSNMSTYTVYQPGNYAFHYQDSVCHTWRTDYITVTNPPVPIGLLPVSLTVCANTTQQLFAGTDFPVTWNDGSTNPYHAITYEGVYWVDMHGVCGNVRDSITISFIDPASYQFGFPDTITVCSNSLPYNLHGNGSQQLNSYLWSNGSTAANLLVSTQGTYSVTAQHSCGTVRDTTYIRILQQPATLLPADQSFCNGQQTQFVLHGAPGAINTWSTGVTADSIVVTQSGTYQISSLGPNGCVTIDAIAISFSDLYMDEINDTILCPGQTLSIMPNTNATTVFMGGNPTNLPIMVSDTGNYFIFAYENACVVYTTFHVGSATGGSFDIHLPDSTFACSDNLPLTLSAGNQFSQYLWSNGATTPTITVNTGGWYGVEASYSCASGHDSTFVVIAPPFSMSLPADTLLCPGQSLTLAADPQYGNVWSTGSTANQITVNAEGTYWLQSTNGGCVKSDTIQVETSDLFLQPMDDDGFCAKQNITLEAITNGNILWSTGQTVSTVTYNQAGTYWVQATLGGCTLTETFTLTQLPSPSFTLGADIAVPSGPVTIGIPNTFTSYHWNVGNTTSTISVNTPGTYILTATNSSGCSTSDTVKVYFTTGITDNPADGMYLNIPQVISPSHGPLLAQYGGIQLTSVSVYDATGKLISTGRNNFPTVWDGTSGAGSTAAVGIYYYTLHYVTDAGKPGIYHGKVLMIE